MPKKLSINTKEKDSFLWKEELVKIQARWN